MGKLKKELNSHNLLYYVVAFCIIIVLVTLTMGGYLYYFYYNTIYADFLTGNTQHLSAIASRHENDMQIADNIVMQVSLADEVTEFMLEKQPEKSIKLEEQLRRYTTVSEFFNLLFYHYHKDNYMYSYHTSIKLDNFHDYGCKFEVTTAEQFTELIKDDNAQLRIVPEQDVAGRWIVNYIGNSRTVMLFRAIPPYYRDTLIFMIPDTYYDNLLKSEAKDLRHDFLMYEDSLIVSRGAFEFSEEGIEALKAECSKLEEVQHKVKIDGETYLLTTEIGETGILYGTLQSMEIFHDKIMAEQWGILFLIMICIIPVTFIVVIGSDKIMKKVKNLNMLLNEEANYNLSSIENGIQTLVMSHKESESEHLMLKKTRFIRDFIRGGYQSREEVLAEAVKAGLSIDYEQCLVILTRSREINDENKVHATILEIIEENEYVNGYGVHLINNNQNLFVVFGNECEKLEKVLHMMLGIEKNYCEDYVIAVSNYHRDFTEGAKAFLEADTAFDNHLLMDNSQIIRFAEVAQTDYVTLLPDIYLQKLKYIIKTGDKAAVEPAVTDICSKMKGENASLYSFRMLYNDIIHILLQEWQGDKTVLDNFYNVFTLSQCLNIQDFQELLCEVCIAIIDNKEGKVIQNSDIVEDAVAYMQENFHNPELTMSALAEYLQVSSVTLSVEFKNEMDIKPSEYLANLRMEKAKELLRNTNMLVREISQAVGYEDDHVFMRRFKKHTGMTPGQYRAE